MEPPQSLDVSSSESDCSPHSPTQKVQLVSLLVQLLHSHTFDQDQNLDKFIFNYRQRAGFRKQLSQTLRMFLYKHQGYYTSTDLVVFDYLETLRSFVEKLYEQRSDTGIDYPIDEMLEVCYYSAKLLTRGNTTAEMLGGAFVLVDVILAVHRFGDHRKNRNRRTVKFMNDSFKALTELLHYSDVEHKIFLLSSKPFISCTKALLQSHVQVRQVHFSRDLLETIGKFLRCIVCYEPQPPIRFQEQSEIVELMLRTAIGVNLDNHYDHDILADLLMSARNCLCESWECRIQLASVVGWADYLLSQLERLLLEADKRMERFELEFSGYNNDHFILEMIHLLLMLQNRLSPDENERFVKLCSTPKICQALVSALIDSFYSIVSCVIVQYLMENRLFVEQLRKCGMVEALQKYRFSITNKPDNGRILERIDNILSALVRPD